MALLSLVYGVCTVLGVDAAALAAPNRPINASEILGAVLFAPIAETLCLAAGVTVLSAFISRVALVAIASAVAWGCLHAVFGVLWFFGTAWSFFVFTCGYIAWRRLSFGHAFLAAAVPHALINSATFLLLAILERAA